MKNQWSEWLIMSSALPERHIYDQNPPQNAPRWIYSGRLHSAAFQEDTYVTPGDPPHPTTIEKDVHLDRRFRWSTMSNSIPEGCTIGRHSFQCVESPYPSRAKSPGYRTAICFSWRSQDVVGHLDRTLDLQILPGILDGGVDVDGSPSGIMASAVPSRRVLKNTRVHWH